MWLKVEKIQCGLNSLKLLEIVTCFIGYISNYLGTGSENLAEVPNLFEALAIYEI